MKFLELRVGAQFEYLGEPYQKISPFIAVNLSNNRQKMFKRSTVTTAIESTPPPAHKGREQEPRVSLDEVTQAAGFYHQKISDTLDQLHQGRLSFEQANAAIDQAKEVFFASLTSTK